jgi:hypothetical protein
VSVVGSGGRLPQANATVTAITGPGFSADSDLPAAPGTPKWTGSADGYVTEEQVTSAAAGRLDLLSKDAIVVPGDLRPAVDIALGDTVTFVYAGAEQTRTVRAVRARLLNGVRQTVKLDLEDA